MSLWPCSRHMIGSYWLILARIWTAHPRESTSPRHGGLCPRQKVGIQRPQWQRSCRSTWREGHRSLSELWCRWIWKHLARGVGRGGSRRSQAYKCHKLMQIPRNCHSRWGSRKCWCHALCNDLIAVVTLWGENTASTTSHKTTPQCTAGKSI